MSDVARCCKKYNIQDFAEVSMLENFFEQGEIQSELAEAEKFRKIRYVVLFVALLFVVGGILFVFGNGMVSVTEGKNSIQVRPSTFIDGIMFAVIAGSIVASGIIWLFRKKLEGALKSKTLPKLGKELYSKLVYDQGKAYAFGDLGELLQANFLSGYDTIDAIEDSLGFTLDEPYRHVAVQGYELKTSRITRDSKGRSKKTITNHCYLLRVKFPEARIELANDLRILTDEADTFSRSLSYGLIGLAPGMILPPLIGLSAMYTFVFSAFCFAIAVIVRRWYIARKRVRLENVEFEKYFDVHCEDQIGSRMIITPAFMDRLVQLAKSSKFRYELLYKSDRFYIKWNVDDSYLEINTWKNIRENVETFIAWYAQMKEILNFVFDMRMMYYAKFQADTTKPDTIPVFENMQSHDTSFASSISQSGGVIDSSVNNPLGEIQLGGLFSGILTAGSILSKFR